MGLRERWDEQDTAVKVLIGVATLFVVSIVAVVGIAVLAAVVGTVVFGLGNPGAAVPQASFAMRYDDGRLAITHDGGDAIDASTLTVAVGDTRTEPWSDDDGIVEVGDTLRLRRVGGDTTVVVRWQPPGETAASTTLAVYETP
ncbi:MAG: type IV pilin N-terminal domain-containing protein [Haloarculaceae archaeon]